MWTFTLSADADLKPVLLCSNQTSNPKSINTIHLSFVQDNTTLFCINLQSARSELIHSKFARLAASALLSSTKTRIIFALNHGDNGRNFIEAINIFNDEVEDFEQLRAEIGKHITFNKAAAIVDTTQARLQALRNFENSADNNMSKVVFFSGRRSEARLRAAYNFPSPMYEDTNPYVGISTADLDPASAVLVEEMLISDGQSYEEDEHDTEEYSPEENSLIASLINKLTNYQNKLITIGYLGAAGNLNETSINLINITINTDTAKDLEKSINLARNALNIITTLRALKPGGSHSHNGNMRQTGIVGYGMRNIVALVWKACLHAKAHKLFMPGITAEDAVFAIARGIANGARDGNRNLANNLTLFDDLGPDSRGCDQGRYNDLFKELDCILPEISLVYDVESALHTFIKTEIIKILITQQDVTSYARARQYLETWRTGKPEVQDRSMGCRLFEKAIKDNFPKMLSTFLDAFCGADIHGRQMINDEIQKQIEALSKTSLYSYVENIAPEERELELKWKEAHPVAESQSEQRLGNQSKRLRNINV